MNNHLASAAPKPAVRSNAPTATPPVASSAANSDKPPAAVGTMVARPKILLIGALVTAAIGFGLIALLFHRSRTASGPSLITQMMSDPRKK
jgi:hypothetical protein